MALPKLKTPTYELELPSTGEKVKYRPFLVKEQKHLMIAMESEKSTELRDALATLVSSCTFEKINPYEVPMFDIEFMFLRFRGKSVGEIVKLNVLCPDDEKTRVEVEINLEDVGVKLEADHTNEIEITKKIKIIMKYPDLNDMVEMENEKEAVSATFNMIKRCVHEIHDGETIYPKVDMSDTELAEFLDNMTTEPFEKIQNFFTTMPKIIHVVKVTNPKTKKKGEVVIEGIESFFE
jgi:hypothetical protein